jgi:hypothetical protein
MTTKTTHTVTREDAARAERPRVYHIHPDRRAWVDIEPGVYEDLGLRVHLDVGEEQDVIEEIVDDGFDDIEYQLPAYEFSATALAEWTSIVEERLRAQAAKAPRSTRSATSAETA